MKNSSNGQVRLQTSTTSSPSPTVTTSAGCLQPIVSGSSRTRTRTSWSPTPQVQRPSVSHFSLLCGTPATYSTILVKPQKPTKITCPAKRRPLACYLLSEPNIVFNKNLRKYEKIRASRKISEIKMFMYYGYSKQCSNCYFDCIVVTQNYLYSE